MYSQKKSWKGITLTKAAVQRILQLINIHKNMIGIQITVKKSGCAGFVYNINKVISLEIQNNVICEQEGVKLFVPIDVMPFVDGTELDYVIEGLNQSFKFKNPKARYLCGCGESFGIEE